MGLQAGSSELSFCRYLSSPGLWGLVCELSCALMAEFDSFVPLPVGTSRTQWLGILSLLGCSRIVAVRPLVIFFCALMAEFDSCCPLPFGIMESLPDQSTLAWRCALSRPLAPSHVLSSTVPGQSSAGGPAERSSTPCFRLHSGSVERSLVSRPGFSGMWQILRACSFFFFFRRVSPTEVLADPTRGAH